MRHTVLLGSITKTWKQLNAITIANKNVRNSLLLFTKDTHYDAFVSEVGVLGRCDNVKATDTRNANWLDIRHSDSRTKSHWIETIHSIREMTGEWPNPYQPKRNGRVWPVMPYESGSFCASNGRKAIFRKAMNFAPEGNMLMHFDALISYCVATSPQCNDNRLSATTARRIDWIICWALIVAMNCHFK